MKTLSLIAALILMQTVAVRAESLYQIPVKDIDGKDTSLNAKVGEKVEARRFLCARRRGSQEKGRAPENPPPGLIPSLQPRAEPGYQWGPCWSEC